MSVHKSSTLFSQFLILDEPVLVSSKGRLQEETRNTGLLASQCSKWHLKQVKSIKVCVYYLVSFFEDHIQ